MKLLWQIDTQVDPRYLSLMQTAADCAVWMEGVSRPCAVNIRTWNIVRIGGTYYHLDATFDNTLGKSDKVEDIRYDYFNLDDKQIFKDHEPLIAAAPHCTDHDHFYYKEKKLSFTKTEDVYKRSLQAAKKGKTLTFHWRGGYLTREVLNELLGLIRKAGEEKNKTAVVNINWPQAVLRLYYTEAQMQECITMEDANEGEKE